MAQPAENVTPLYGNVIVVENFLQTEKPVTGKNRDFERKEAINGSVEPIRSQEDIQRIANYFLEKREYRNWCLFIIGINCGLRVSDLVRLRISDVAFPVYDGNYITGFTAKDIGTTIRIKPKKTAKKNKYVYIKINSTMKAAIQKYLDMTGQRGFCYYTYFVEKGWLFPTIKASNVSSKRTQEFAKEQGDPIDEDSVGKIMRKVQKDLKLSYNLGTHSLRKTFGYRFFRQNQSAGKQEFALAALQEIFQHSSQKTTLGYIGISKDEINSMLESYDCGLELSDIDGDV